MIEKHLEINLTENLPKLDGIVGELVPLEAYPEEFTSPPPLEPQGPKLYAALEAITKEAREKKP